MLRNEVKSDMAPVIGQLVLKNKADLSLDSNLPVGQDVRMASASKKPLTRYDLEFLARTHAAREAAGLTQEEMALKLGGLSQDRYKQYEIRSPLPHSLIPAFLEAAKVDYEYLFTGRGQGPAAHKRYEILVERQKQKKKLKKAA